MTNPEFGISITDIKIRFVSCGTDGLKAWASCVMNGAVKLNNIAIRQSRDGSIFLTYPAKRTSGGSTHHFFHPITREAAGIVECAIMAHIRELSASLRPEQEGMVNGR